MSTKKDEVIEGLRKNKKIIRVGVSKLVYLLYAPEKLLNPPPKWVLEDSRALHWKLGFDNTRIFSRYFIYDDNIIFLISGVPDKINEKEGYIEELKTYNAHYNNLELIRKIGLGQLLIYAYLTGLTKLRLWLYEKRTKELTSEEYSVDYHQVLAFVKKALKNYLKFLNYEESENERIIKNESSV